MTLTFHEKWQSLMANGISVPNTKYWIFEYVFARRTLAFLIDFDAESRQINQRNFCTLAFLIDFDAESRQINQRIFDHFQIFPNTYLLPPFDH